MKSNYIPHFLNYLWHKHKLLSTSSHLHHRFCFLEISVLWAFCPLFLLFSEYLFVFCFCLFLTINCWLTLKIRARLKLHNGSRLGLTPWNVSCFEFKFDVTRLSSYYKNKIGPIIFFVGFWFCKASALLAISV